VVTGGVDSAWAALEQVMDPEIPMLSVVDLGIARKVEVPTTGSVVVTLTPTYSGCPATEVIAADVRAALEQHFAHVDVRTQLAPAWTTDWITAQGRERLQAAGIAPPTGTRAFTAAPSSMRTIAQIDAAAPATPTCPRCGSAEVEEISRFGSTSCKSLWRCLSCAEPFDHFKPL
jgi:ring-1,2-phenylacetyl-CoA epoxidase subunit PaaD